MFLFRRFTSPLTVRSVETIFLFLPKGRKKEGRKKHLPEEVKKCRFQKVYTFLYRSSQFCYFFGVAKNFCMW